MDPIYLNEIASDIHLLCVKYYAHPSRYVSDSNQFKKNIQNCFIYVLDQQKIVNDGMEDFVKFQ